MSSKKILYALNGTGSGHITRAREIIPYLREKHKVDVLISGSNYILNTKLIGVRTIKKLPPTPKY